MKTHISPNLLRFVCSIVVIGTCTLSAYGKCVNKRFYVEKYGTDKNAFAQLAKDVNANGGGRIVFPADVTYEIEIADDPNGGHAAFPQETSIILGFRDCQKVFIDMNGSSIIVKKNHSTKYSVFLFYNCKFFQLENGLLIGDARTHDYSSVVFRGKEENSSHQWGYGINAIGSRGKIADMNISFMTGDGIRASSYKTQSSVYHAKVDVSNCNISYCRRNGITIGSTEGITISNTSIHHIGTHDGIVGTLPQAGIDLEYEDKVGDHGPVMINNCNFYECTTSTIVASNSSVPTPSRFVITNSTIEGSYFQITNMQTLDNGEKLVKDCRFVKTPINCGNATIKGCTFEMGDKIHYIHGTTFLRCTFLGDLDSTESKYGGCFGGNTYDPAIFKRCTFKNVRGKNNDTFLQGFSGYTFKIVANFHDCEFFNCSFAQGGAGAESNFSFWNCTLTDGCTIQNRSENMIVFKKSKISNLASYSNQKGRFSFDGCEIIQDDNTVQYPLLYFGNHQVKNCTIVNDIKITPAMKSRGVKAALIKEIK